MNKINDVISKNIKKYRKLNSMTQKQLGNLVGVSTAAVSNWETGSNSIDIDSLFKVCKALNVSISEITEDKVSFEINGYERQLVQKYREAGILDQLTIAETLKMTQLPPHLLRYMELLKEKWPHIKNPEV